MVLGLANQVVPHTGSWRPPATAVNYIVSIASIVYIAFQAQHASPVGVQLDSIFSNEREFVPFPSIELPISRSSSHEKICCPD
ncbi:hypothetical protein DSO57_1006161 [Entomophthora muscae]|uniref:Uncharacterized protein n=1 Tax=Entomophthora muscae TaxID=34485 RepID=A0ACC2UUQ8_9FUNG|nr:hypothetical protein DSO57_1006161 [Entomophthora muscae]